MIAHKAVQDFLNADLFDWNFIKKVPKEEILLEFLKEYPDFKWKTFEPYEHQYKMLLVGLFNKRFLYFSDPGTGKSLVSLQLLKFYKQFWGKCLILSPSTTSCYNWKEQIELHTDFSSTELVGTVESRWDELENLSTDLYNLNYTGLQLMLTRKVKNKKGKLKWEVDCNKIDIFREIFQAIIIDESHKTKNHQSLNFEILKKLTKNMPIVYGLTGTPMDKTPMDLWSQFYLVDRGETLGSTLGIYRQAFFKEKSNYWGGMDYKFKTEMEEKLNKRLGNKSIRYREEEANELPPLMENTININFPIENQKYYREVIDKFVISKQDTEEKKQSFHKLRMICSGFYGLVNEDKEKINFNMPKNPKMEFVLDLLESMPEDAKMIIFLDYVHSGKLVSDALTKAKIKHERLYAGTKDKKKAVETFKKDSKCRVFVINTQSGGESLNLQEAQYMVFYELPLSLIQFTQARKRSHRTGQLNTVFLYNLVTKGTIEEKLYQYLIEGKSLYAAIIEGKEDLK